jgi:hypothetical protein
MEEQADQDDVNRIIALTNKLGWNKGKVSLEVDPNSTESSRLMLIGKILSRKTFSRQLVKEILTKAWNVLHEVEVSVADRNVFVFTFKHEADIRRAWDRRPWLVKGEHLILKKYNPDLNFNEVDFSYTEFWVQVHGLPLNRQYKENLLRVGGFIGRALEVDLVGTGNGSYRKFVRVRVEFDITQPLVTGFPLDRKNLPDLWISFKYEKLGNFCYGCGRLGHEQTDCMDPDIQLLLKDNKKCGIFDKWLRADNDCFQSGIQLKKIRSHELIDGSTSTQSLEQMEGGCIMPSGSNSQSYQNNSWQKSVQWDLQSWNAMTEEQVAREPSTFDEGDNAREVMEELSCPESSTSPRNESTVAEGSGNDFSLESVPEITTRISRPITNEPGPVFLKLDHYQEPTHLDQNIWALSVSCISPSNNYQHTSTSITHYPNLTKPLSPDPKRHLPLLNIEDQPPNKKPKTQYITQPLQKPIPLPPIPSFFNFPTETTFPSTSITQRQSSLKKLTRDKSKVKRNLKDCSSTKASINTESLLTSDNNGEGRSLDILRGDFVFSSFPVSVQMAEEAGLIKPHPSP